MADMFEDIRRQVVESGGIKCFKMQTLREASIYKKLGPGVNKELSDLLHQKSLDHSEMPVYQDEAVYVYEQGSKAAQLINAILGTPTGSGAEAILTAVAPDQGSNGAEQKLEEIRALAVQLNDVFADRASA
jgi:hypothetical protein